MWGDIKIMKGETEIKKAICVGCKAECGVLVHVRDGQLIKAVEDPDFPYQPWPRTSGCARLKAVPEWFYHPDRVNFPLKRVGEKGSGKWEKISWEQAMDEIAEQLASIRERYGPESIAFSMGTSYKSEMTMLTRFFQVMGTAVNGIGCAQICFWPRAQVANAIVGMFPHFSVKPATRCIVCLGAEPLVSRPGVANNMREALKQGAKLIVLDPRYTQSASMADVWLQLRPSTDLAVLMGMINVMIEEELYDKEFVKQWCDGFEQLKERAKNYPPDVVERISEVPADKIREAARVYASNRPGCMVEGMGIEELPLNAEILHARWILAALAANIDIEGGEELTGPHPELLGWAEVEPKIPPRPEQLKKQLGADKAPLLSWPGRQMMVENLRRVWPKLPSQAIVAHHPAVVRSAITSEPYPTRAILTHGSNPMVTCPNIKFVYKALKSLDLYVVTDMWMTPSADIADYVLPAAGWMERPLLWDFNGYNRFLKAGEAAMPASNPPEYDHRNDYDVWRELAIRLGHGECFPWNTLEEYYDARLKPMGYTHKEYVHKLRCGVREKNYKKYERVGFATETSKVELYSTVFEKLGYDPLPEYREFSETRVGNPELAKEYPLTLITGGRNRQYYHSDFRQIESVRKTHPHPLVQIHPQTASELGICEGDWVWIKTLRGRVRMKATLFDGMKPDIIHAEHGWWYPELPGEEPWLHGVWESNSNVCLDDDPESCNKLTGGFLFSISQAGIRV
jgi:anaerobic selenocysteine-containing dehydrogenase